MFVRLVYESFRRQTRRKVLAGVAITLGVGVATAMIGVATDIAGKYSFPDLPAGGNYVLTPSKAGDYVASNGVINNLSSDVTINLRLEPHVKFNIRVADPSGKEFKVFLPNIEMPCDIWWKGRWIDRFRDPEGEEAYRKVVTSNVEL